MTRKAAPPVQDTQDRIGSMVEPALIAALREGFPPIPLRPGVDPQRVLCRQAQLDLIDYLDNCRRGLDD
jgi:hypothetical protein